MYFGALFEFVLCYKLCHTDLGTVISTINDKDYCTSVYILTIFTK